MKILIVFSSRYPNPGAASKRISNYGKALSLRQNQFKVLSIVVEAKVNYLNFLMSPLIPFVAFWKVLNEPYKMDVVYIYGFGWVGQGMIILASKMKGKAVGIEVCEKPYSIMGSRRDILFKFLYPIHHLFLKSVVFKWADGFIVISEALSDYIMNLKKNKAIVCKIPILVDYEYYQTEVAEPDCFKPFSLHAATVNNHKDGMLNVFQAFGRLIAEDNVKIHLYLTSEIMLPEIKKQIVEIIEFYGLNSYVHFTGDLDEGTLLRFQKSCSFIVINKNDSEQNRYNFSTKIGEYLALGKPIITTKVGEVTNFLADKESCLFIDPQNVDQIIKSIKLLLADMELKDKITRNGRAIAQQKFDYVMNSKSINDFFENLISKGRKIERVTELLTK